MAPALDLSRSQVLGFRRRVGGLDQRRPYDTHAVRRAAWAGLQDSMPRAALLSLHARVEGVDPQGWEAPGLVQVWGPRASVYVVAEPDVGVFTLGRSATGAKRQQADELAARLATLLGGERRPYGEAGRALGVHPNELRRAAPTGTVLLRWDGATQPVVWTVPPPAMEPGAARAELARRHLHVFGPSGPDAFATWAGVSRRAAAAAFDALTGALTEVRTPLGDAWILAEDEDAIRAGPGPTASARLLPSGDAYYLLWGRDRELLVADPDQRRTLWTDRVWPGAVLVEGEVVATWRRQQHVVTIDPWQRLTAAGRQAVTAEAAGLPLPVDREVVVRWTT